MKHVKSAAATTAVCAVAPGANVEAMLRRPEATGIAGSKSWSQSACPTSKALAQREPRATRPEAAPSIRPAEGAEMAVCDVCGNDYDKAMEISVGGSTRVFDSFECAIHALAPRCAHCGCTVIGQGHEADGTVYCCAHRARERGVGTLADHGGRWRLRRGGWEANEPASQPLASARPVVERAAAALLLAAAQLDPEPTISFCDRPEHRESAVTYERLAQKPGLNFYGALSPLGVKPGAEAFARAREKFDEQLETYEAALRGWLSDYVAAADLRSRTFELDLQIGSGTRGAFAEQVTLAIDLPVGMSLVREWPTIVPPPGPPEYHPPQPRSLSPFMASTPFLGALSSLDVSAVQPIRRPQVTEWRVLRDGQRLEITWATSITDARSRSLDTSSSGRRAMEPFHSTGLCSRRTAGGIPRVSWDS